MKLSNISIIFIIIVIPIILLFSYYISLQTDTINMQTSYTSKHLRATKEAIEAFEINTVEWNEAYSANADSKRRDVMASINTFTTSFANGIGVGGVNKEIILTYIPAIAATLYDGLYIYTPSETKEVIKDKNGVAVFVKQNLVNYGEKSGRPITFSDNQYDSNDEGKLLYEYDSNKGGTPHGVYKYEDKDGNFVETQFTLNSAYAKTTYEHILKPFNTYSARYKNGDTDITINYTLDNYITIYGTVEDEYVVKSGYLIKTRNDLTLYSEKLTEKIAWRWKEDGAYICETYPYVYADDNTKVYFEEDNTTPEEDYITFQVSSTGIRTDLEKTTSIKYKKIRENSGGVIYQALNTGTIDVKNEETGVVEPKLIKQESLYRNKIGESADSVQENIEDDIKNILNDHSSRNYYIESTAFTEWVKEKLSDIKIDHMQGVQDKSIYGNVNDKLFDFDDPEHEDSIIVRHKREIIKQTLISNLNQSITSYSRNSNAEYSLPILTEEDWEHVFRNVSIITFIQNIPIGLKSYNNYAVATSTENKEYTNPEEIYLSREGDDYYHLPYCVYLSDDTSIIGYRNIDYVVKSYNQEQPDKTIKTNYYFKHPYKIGSQDFYREACYYCLVQRDLYSSEGLSDDEKGAHDKAYKIALARERYRNISEINLTEDTEYRILVTFDTNQGISEMTEKLVKWQGAYKDR